MEATNDAILWNVPKLDSLDGWKLAHLFAGSFSGWSQASDAIHHNVDCIFIDSQVTIELDTRIAYAWSASFGHELFAAPLGPEFIPPSDGHFGICGSVHEKTILRALSWTSNVIYTLWPPCPSWSKGGKSMGLYATDGWDFLEVTHLCMLGKPLACVFECSDDVNKHKHFVHIQHAMQLAGYKMVYSQNVPVHELTHNLRTGWFGAWIRSDVAKDGKILPKLTARALVQWSSERYRFSLPQEVKSPGSSEKVPRQTVAAADTLCFVW